MQYRDRDLPWRKPDEFCSCDVPEPGEPGSLLEPQCQACHLLVLDEHGMPLRRNPRDFEVTL